MKKTGLIAIIGGVVAIFAIVFGVMSATKDVGKTQSTLSTEAAQKSMSDMLSQIDVAEAEPIRGQIDAVSKEEADKEELPEITDDSIVVRGNGELNIEIWSSPEKAGTGTDDYLVRMAEGFNSSGMVIDGKKASVTLRSMASGLGVDYIASGVAAPVGYTPSNDLFVKLLQARGAKAEVLRERLVGNVAGVVFNHDTYNKLIEKYGSIDVKAVTESVANGEIDFGYTNPFTSSTGLNFLISVLYRYDSKNPLSDTAKEGFASFQKNVPLVAMTTVQLCGAAERGALDGFVLERQLFENDPTLKANYDFVTFGYRHDNPMVLVGDVDSSKQNVLEAFCSYCEDNGADDARRCGFNLDDEYVCELPDVDGATLVQAQALYKAGKDGSSAVAAVFVADVSGSMSGQPLKALQDSLKNGMRYIGDGNYIGLVTYSDGVTVDVPVKKFDLDQRSLFVGAIDNMKAGGGTATYDAIIVAADMVQKIADETGAKPIIFVLSDGETNMGYVNLDDMTSVIGGLHIPVHTIGYNADIAALEKISAVGEASVTDATTSDVAYQIKQLFNANV